VASRLGARLDKLEAVVLPKHSPAIRYELVIVHPDGTSTVHQTIGYAPGRGCWTTPAPAALDRPQ
jgi:hypothetical protein